MQVHCSKGTYIRTLCADIGEVLGVGACMESLVRTRVSVFPLEEAHTLAEIEKIRDEGTLEELILPVDRVFEGKTKLTVVPEAFRFLQNGNRLNDGNFTDVPEKIADGEQVLVYDPMGHFYAVYQYERETKDYKVRKMFRCINMICWNKIEDFHIEEPTALSLGKFDGVHRGHEALIEHLLEKKKEGLKAVVFTFDIPPKKNVEHIEAKVLTTNEEKMHIFEGIGIDYLIECPFTREVMCMEPEDFIRMLVEKLNVKCIVAGEDFHFWTQQTR